MEIHVVFLLALLVLSATAFMFLTASLTKTYIAGISSELEIAKSAVKVYVFPANPPILMLMNSGMRRVTLEDVAALITYGGVNGSFVDKIPLGDITLYPGHVVFKELPVSRRIASISVEATIRGVPYQFAPVTPSDAWALSLGKGDIGATYTINAFGDTVTFTIYEVGGCALIGSSGIVGRDFAVVQGYIAYTAVDVENGSDIYNSPSSGITIKNALMEHKNETTRCTFVIEGSGNKRARFAVFRGFLLAGPGLSRVTVLRAETVKPQNAIQVLTYVPLYKSGKEFWRFLVPMIETAGRRNITNVGYYFSGAVFVGYIDWEEVYVTAGELVITHPFPDPYPTLVVFSKPYVVRSH